MNPILAFPFKRTIPVEYTYDSNVQEAINRSYSEGWTLPTESKLKHFDKFIKNIKANNLSYWNGRSTFQMYSFNDLSFENFSRINIKNPSADLAVYNAVTYNLNGIFCNGTTSFVNTKFIASDIDSIGISTGYGSDLPINNGGVEGVRNRTPNKSIEIIPSYSGTSEAYKSNDNSFKFESSGTVNKKLRHYGRVFSNKYLLANGTEYNITTSALTPLIDIPYYLGASNDRGTAVSFSEGTRFMFAGGLKVTLTESIQLKIDINNYLSAIGLNLIP